MRLVPRQLQRVGMTGTVPYYGGRLSPAQAYAVSHSASQRASEPAAAAGEGAETASAELAPGELTDKLVALQQLLDSGVLTQEEYELFRQRVLQ